MELFPGHLQEWRTVFESEDPQKETIPLESGEELTRMQLLCVLRCLRPDKVVAAVQDFVAGGLVCSEELMEEKFSIMFNFDFSLIYTYINIYV